MQRTVKTVQMDVVKIENGKPITKTEIFATKHKSKVKRICKKKDLLPIWESAERFDNLYQIDDEEFFKIAKLVKSTKATFESEEETEEETEEEDE